MCPNCGRQKMQFETEGEAKRFIQYNGADISEHPETLRVYYCDACCCYHISSKPFKKVYETMTNRLIDAYYSTTKRGNNKTLEQFGGKYTLIGNITKLVKEHPDVTISVTGKEKIVSFKVIGCEAYGIDEHNHIHNLHNCEPDVVTSIYNKIIKKVG